ncbi:MAG: LLM class flavin-dependent oxidoreductase, partial [Reyranella sp.]|nr:LLM class flavin-dependent oxidoreductase [Reyranella sp.]
GFNEHHCSPYGLMNSPNLMASAAAQRTRRLKLLIYGNLLPLHEPLRLAEELAMLDCLSNGRIISGFARGIPREYQVHNVPLDQSRARFEEAYDIVTRAWTEDVFSYSGKFWSYEDVAIWPRPVQRPHPPVWIPIVGSKESIEFAGRHDIPITPGLAGGGLRNDIIRFYAKCLADAGHRITPDHMSLALNAYVADSKAQAVREVAPYHLYFNRTLFSHGSFTETAAQRKVGYVSQASTDYVRPENQRAAALLREDFRSMTMADVERMAETMPWGTASEVAERIIAQAEAAGANTVQIGFNRGAMPHDMFMNQIRRFASEVLPRLQAYEVRAVPLASEAAE